MAFDDKAFWRKFIDVRRTAWNVKNALAGIALEMVVMAHRRELVARALTGKVDTLKPAFLVQGLEMPIDRGDAQ